MLQKTKGNALLITLILMVVSGSIIGMVARQTSNAALMANRARQYQALQSAATGSLEYAYGVWLRRVANKHNLLYTASDLAITGPSFQGKKGIPTAVNEYLELTTTAKGVLTIQPLDKNGRALGKDKLPDAVISSVPGYKGWWGRTYTYMATIELQTPDGKVKAGARRLFYYSEVPLFQCMFFFQDSLEIYNPAKITLTGLIHTNGDLYLSAQQSSWLKIGNNVTYSGTYYPAVINGKDNANSIPPGARSTDSDIGVLENPTWLNGCTATKVSSISAMGENFEAIFSDTTYTCSVTASANVSGGFHELIEPASTTDDPISEKRLSNIAANTNNQTTDTGGLLIYITGTVITASSIEITSLDSVTHLPVISNSTCSVHVGVGAGAAISNTTAFIKALVSSTSAAISKKLANSGSSMITGTARLYDARESRYMNVVDIDLKALQAAISNNITNFSNIIYINDASMDTTYKSGGTSMTTENTIRILNGSVISNSNGLTIASYNPVYLQGDFNTGGTGNSVPANVQGSQDDASPTAAGYTSKATSIVADCVSLLSSNWSDTKSNSTLGSRNPSNTTYNVALLGGYILSGTSDNFSGGAINYPRFLENWNGSAYCTYYGSMVELFPSLSSTACWVQPNSNNSKAYYTAPYRRYNFDTQFSSNSPPGSVNAVVLSRGFWSPWSPN